MQINLKRFIRLNFLRLKRLRGNPHSLAFSLALGVFVGLTPTLPLHTIIIICICILLRVSPIAAIIGSTIVSNPLTFALQYYLAWKIGDLCLPDRLTWDRVQETLQTIRAEGMINGMKTLSDLSIDGMLVMMCGGLLLALPFAVISYYLSFIFFQKIRKKRREKHVLH